MNFQPAWRRLMATGLTVALCTVAWASAPGKSDKKDKPVAGAIDAGSFGVFIKGQRVLTETFVIEQQNGVSLIKSQLKEDSSGSTSGQKCNLEITPSGELLRYEWSETGGGSLTVVPSNDFLTERVSPATGKPSEKAFLMPSTSAILDNNFFIQREVLAWRYLASDCKSEGGALKCQQGPAEFGAVVPQDNTSLRVRIELIGKEKVKIRGVERDLLRLNLGGETFDWQLWVDDQDHFKLIRVAIPADNTEVVRD